MKKKYSFLEDDFELEKFKEELSKTVEKKYYEKNKFKYGVIYFLIMVISVAIAFFIYGILQNYINMLTGMV